MSTKLNIEGVLAIVKKQGGLKLTSLLKEAEKQGIVITKEQVLLETEEITTLTPEFEGLLDFIGYGKEGSTVRFFIVEAGTEFYANGDGDDEEDEATTAEVEAEDDQQEDEDGVGDVLPKDYFTGYFVVAGDQITKFDETGAAIGAQHVAQAAGAKVQLFGAVPLTISYTHTVAEASIEALVVASAQASMDASASDDAEEEDEDQQ